MGTHTARMVFSRKKKDQAVPAEQTINAYERMKQLNADHDSWTLTFENNDVYLWLLSHHLE